ncbi:MAG: response regulator transcription factor [Desulfobacterales bacterium]
MKTKYKIFLVDDHALLRNVLKTMINQLEDYEVVGEAGDGMEAIRKIKIVQPDLILLDLNMPKMGGFSVLKEIQPEHKDLKVIVLTMNDNEDIIADAYRSGIDGYCLKNANFDELQLIISAVLSGKRYISPEISENIIGGFLETEKKKIKDPLWVSLTQREREVLKLIGEGYSSKEIADFLFISPSTVDKHRTNMRKKLGLNSNQELKTYAVTKKLAFTEEAEDYRSTFVLQHHPHG